MRRRVISAGLLLVFGLLLAADLRAAHAAMADGPGACCCCGLAESPLAVGARLCCGLACGDEKNDAPAAPEPKGATATVAPHEVLPPPAPTPDGEPAVAVRLAAAGRARLAHPAAPTLLEICVLLI